MGMLMSAAYILAMDTFGPITDNAGGIVEMSNQPEAVREVTDKLDSVGNTTKALTKGYAVGTAALAAFLLFSAYMEEVGITGSAIEVDLANVPVFIGGLIGATLVFLFTSLSIRAVGEAGDMIEEVRRQFRKTPASWPAPPTRLCALRRHLTAGAAQMVLPGILAVAGPVFVGLPSNTCPRPGSRDPGGRRPPDDGDHNRRPHGDVHEQWRGLGQCQEIHRGWIHLQGVKAGKGSDPHLAAVVGDTVGDPFKDTAGPSLHVLIKLLATITLVFAPLFVR